MSCAQAQAINPVAPAATRPVIVERKTYVSQGRQEQFIVPLIRQAVEAALASHAHRGGKALDVGCGGQPFRQTIESHGMSYASMDAVPQPGVTTDFLAPIDGVLPDALTRSGPFDLILCTEVLEHVADWNAAWTNLSSLLAPGGRLILTCPFFYPLHEEPYDFYRPTHHAIAHWAAKNGLEIINQRRLGTAWDVIGTAIAASGPSPASRWPHAWLIGTLASKTRKLVCWALKRRLFQRWIDTRQTMYLANFAVLGKPTASPGGPGGRA